MRMNKYWNTFDELIDLLKRNSKQEIATQVEKVKGYANGLTDGWYNQIEGLNDLELNHKSRLSNSEMDKLIYLKEHLAKILKK